jgi:hypothetical protein
MNASSVSKFTLGAIVAIVSLLAVERLDLDHADLYLVILLLGVAAVHTTGLNTFLQSVVKRLGG